MIQQISRPEVRCGSFATDAERAKIYRCPLRSESDRQPWANEKLTTSAPPRRVLAAALANKLARIAWTVLAQERSYEERVTEIAA